jgi:hypothetical protein
MDPLYSKTAKRNRVNRELKIIAVFSSSLICTADISASYLQPRAERWFGENEGCFLDAFICWTGTMRDHLEASISDEASEGASKPKDYLYPESCRWVLIEGPNSESQPAFHLHPPCFEQRHR